MVNVIKLVHKQLKIFRKLSSIESNFEAPKSNTDSDDEICSFANFVLWKSNCEFLHYSTLLWGIELQLHSLYLLIAYRPPLDKKKVTILDHLLIPSPLLVS